MLVAEIVILTSHGFAFGSYGSHTVGYDCLQSAEIEYRRVVDLLERKDKKANDLPRVLEIVGSAGNKVSVMLDDLHSVALTDFERLNKQRSGIKEAFPNLFS